MTDEIDGQSPEDIMRGTTAYLLYLEECSDQECIYTYEQLIRGSVLLYDFKDK